ncbi:MAG TPA: hypothetical protein GXX26_08805 [Clostridiaceae bacterium]|nr:hypothetical protein [Clostridiaceae bacterium]
MERMENRIIVRTVSNLSFAGERVTNNIIAEEKGILLKTSPISNIRIWFPAEEIESIIYPDGRIVHGDSIAGTL